MAENLFSDKDISDIVGGYRTGETSPAEVAENCISRIEKLDGEFKAWVCFDREKLMGQAETVRKRLKSGEKPRPLEGIPLAVKDIFNTSEFPTQMGSPLWKGFTPGNDSRVVYYAKEAGAVVPGKTVTAEFAVHTLDKTLNPHDVTRTPGTSSSGSAVAIALGMVPAALGTQTAGSITRPASFCGIYGCKPSFGLIPRTGMLKTTDSLDTVGFFTARYNDLKLLFETFRVHGPNFPFSNNALTDAKRQIKPANRPWRILFAKTHTWDNAYGYAKDEMEKFISLLSNDENIEIVEKALPSEFEKTHEIHAIVYDKALSYYFKEEFSKKELVSPIMTELIEHGNSISVETYHAALKKQTEMIHSMDGIMEKYDALVSLSTAGEAPLREEREKPDPALMWTLTHLPIVCAPAFKSPSGLPFGLQIASRKYNDYLMFSFADYLNSKGYIPDRPNPCLEL